jgi:peptidylprolyl isomerase
MNTLLTSLVFVLACTDAEKKDGTEKTEVTSETSKDAKVDAKTKEEQVQDLLKKTKKEDIPAPSDVAAAPADAQKTESGLAYKVLSSKNSTDKPKATSKVEVHYTGWTTDGKMFDSSVQRGKTAKFSLNGVIAGWTEGLQLMAVGDKVRFWIPEELAYKGRPGAPAGMLVFDVELVDIEKPIPAPADVTAAPADATKTASGLAYKILSTKDGSDKPGAADKVTVHYTGWTTDGEMFDSSVQRGSPATFGLTQVIAGWTEGLQLVGVGEKARLWIPEELAYKGRPGAPAGMLVFDVELISIKKSVPAPSDVAAAPPDAKKTKSGLAYSVLRAGTGDKPTVADRVKVHYTGWTTDGKMFDSSVQRGTPATFGLKQVIAGWTEGLQLMAVGEKTRLWIPEELAYKGKPGRPAGMLVFDVELIEIIAPKK